MSGAPCTINLCDREGAVCGVVLVDEQDHDAVAAYAWSLGTDGYAYRDDWTGPKRRRIAMHRQLLGLSRGDGLHTDHLNGNRLDNRRTNLRIVTQAQNNQNITCVRARSGHRGVYWHEASGRWRAAVHHGDRQISGGYFDRIEDAAQAAVALRRRVLPFSVEGQQ